MPQATKMVGKLRVRETKAWKLSGNKILNML